MSLTKKDLNDIQTVVKDTVEFLIEKSEQQADIKFDKKLENLEDRIVSRINTEISDIAETTREVLAKINNHENRIIKLETKTSHL